MFSIIEINGGIGKSIMATAVVSGIKKKYPERKVLVITGYPAVFYNHPDVYRVFKFGNLSYFYEEYITNQDVIFFCDEPYRSNGYIKKEKHLIESWGDILGIPCEIKPQIYLNWLEEETVLKTMNINKPLLIFQPFGGPQEQKNQYSWNRDIPIKQAQNLATYLSKDYHIIQPHIDRHFKLENCQQVNLPLRDLFVLIKHAHTVIGIDSFVQHARKCFNKSAYVFWITNTPIVFGYKEHINIFPKTEIKVTNVNDTYLDRYDFTGSKILDYPFPDDMVFDMQSFISKYFSRL